MQGQINLIALSKSQPLLEEIENLTARENYIHLVSIGCNLHLPLKRLLSLNSFPIHKSVMFIDNLSINNALTIESLEKNNKIIKSKNIKTIVYTASDNTSYWNKLLELNVNSMLHNSTTPLKDHLIQHIYDIKNQKYINPYKKFIDTITTVTEELNCYDGPIISFITKRNWDKDSTDFIYHNQNDMLLIKEKGKISFADSLHYLGANVEEIIQGLTTTEKRLLIFIAEGKENKQIADEFFRSARTIEKHKSNIKLKCGFRTMHELYLFKEKIKLSMK